MRRLQALSSVVIGVDGELVEHVQQKNSASAFTEHPVHARQPFNWPVVACRRDGQRVELITVTQCRMSTLWNDFERTYIWCYCRHHSLKVD